MKKWIIGLLVLLLLLFIGVSVLVPDQFSPSRTVIIQSNTKASLRVLGDEKYWAQWWPSTESGKPAQQKAKPVFQYRANNYRLEKDLVNSFVIRIGNRENEIQSVMTVIPLLNDSTLLEWKGILPGSTNPFQKIQKYLQARSIKKDMGEILESLAAFLKNEENIYGLKIRHTRATDTVLVATKFTTTAYPSTSVVYQHIKSLKQYIAGENAAQTGYPMLHVAMPDSSRFESTVALPTDKQLSGNNTISFKRMVAGNILEAEVKGGTHTVEEAMKRLDNYVHDHQLESPAIPFASLITDRTKEPDTTKWITKLYYPIF